MNSPLRERIAALTDQQLTDARNEVWKRLREARTNRDFRIVCIALDREYYTRHPEEIDHEDTTPAPLAPDQSQ
jgi:hypothetical protein